MRVVMGCLIDESEDLVTRRILQERDTYRFLCDCQEIIELPIIEDITDMLF